MIRYPSAIHLSPHSDPTLQLNSNQPSFLFMLRSNGGFSSFRSDNTRIALASTGKSYNYTPLGTWITWITWELQKDLGTVKAKSLKTPTSRQDATNVTTTSDLPRTTSRHFVDRCSSAAVTPFTEVTCWRLLSPPSPKISNTSALFLQAASQPHCSRLGLRWDPVMIARSIRPSEVMASSWHDTQRSQPK